MPVLLLCIYLFVILLNLIYKACHKFLHLQTMWASHKKGLATGTRPAWPFIFLRLGTLHSSGHRLGMPSGWWINRQRERVQILFLNFNLFLFHFIYLLFYIYFCLLEGVRSRSSTPVNLPLFMITIWLLEPLLEKWGQNNPCTHAPPLHIYIYIYIYNYYYYY